jgi:hypothetical protein
MRNRLTTIILAGFALLIVVAPVFAHHGNASYDGKTVTIKGTVTAWLWANPHTFLKLDVTDDDGKVVHWVCENQAPSTLVNFGFTAKTFKPGDVVTVVLAATSKNLPVGRINKIILANGFVMNSEVR